MPPSDPVWRRGPASAAAPTMEPRKTPCLHGPWRRTTTTTTTTTPAALSGLNPLASEFSFARHPAARSGTSPGAYSEASTSTSTTSSRASSTFSALSLSSSPSSSPERQAAPPACPTVLPGFIFRAQIQLARSGASSLLQQQPHVNDQVGHHPTMVWDFYEREDGEKIARCLQMTSFGNRGVEGKYDNPTAWRYHCQYLPVRQCGTTSRTNQPLLELQDGKKMKNQSYVHLDHFFEIEARYLVSWLDHRGVPSVGLTSGSLDVLRAKLMEFATGAIFRKANALIPSPLDSTGLPPVSKEVWDSVARGLAMELVRSCVLADEGKQIWTGLERGVPPF